MEFQVIYDDNNPKSEYFGTLQEAQDFQSNHEFSRIFKRSEENPDLYSEYEEKPEGEA